MSAAGFGFYGDFAMRLIGFDRANLIAIPEEEVFERSNMELQPGESSEGSSGGIHAAGTRKVF